MTLNCDYILLTGPSLRTLTATVSALIFLLYGSQSYVHLAGMLFFYPILYQVPPVLDYVHWNTLFLTVLFPG